MISKAKNKRVHVRKTYGTEIVFSNRDQAYHGTLKNLSLGGAFIETNNVQNVLNGDIVVVNIPYTDGKKYIKKQGVIKWLNHDGFAIEFL